MASSDMPKEPPLRIRFNHTTTHPDAKEDCDYYADDPVIDLEYYEVGWWQGDDKLFRILFPNKDIKPTDLEPRGTRFNPTGFTAPTIRIAKLDRRLFFPIDKSYYTYKIAIFEHQPSSSATLGDEPQVQVAGPKKEGLPPAMLTRAARREAHLTARKPNPAAERLAATLGTGDAEKTSPAPTSADSTKPDSYNLARSEPIIYLFNVIVALEWVPDAQDQQQLAWAFKRASDFLYDVSDGSLAFGQVVFVTDKKLAPYADIVIAASNRFQGRSWVGSIHERAKRMPLRLGRGAWRRGLHIPWDEPEGYRVIVHEWGHYALHLRDAYLHPIFVESTASGTVLRAVANETGRYVFVPNPYVVHSTVMEALEGTSELSLQPHRLNKDMPSEHTLLHALYPSSLNSLSAKAKPDSGPGQMRFPLPHIVFEDTEEATKKGIFYASQCTPAISFRDLNLFPLDEKENEPEANKKMNYDRCWLYVLSPKTEAPNKRKLVAQGTFELRSSYEPFTLIGAEVGDLLVVVVDQAEGPSKVYTETITQADLSFKQDFNLKPVAYQQPYPWVVVRPVYTEDQGQIGAPPDIRISVDLLHTWKPKPTVWLCPLMEDVSEYPVDGTEEVRRINGLDGHVVVWFDDDPFIVCFSHGGNPPSHTIGGQAGETPSFGAVPQSASASSDFPTADVAGTQNVSNTKRVAVPSITAGSSDGTVRIYFSLPHSVSEADQKRFDGLRFVTTVQQNASMQVPRIGAKAMSYPFSIACNRSLQTYPLHMTVEVRYSGLERPKRDGGVFICRLEEAMVQGTYQWKILPTYRFGALGVSAVATSFDEKNTPESAFFDGRSQPFEQYQLWWIPDPHPPAS